MRVRVDNPPKFGRRLCEKILRICSQIPPKFDLLTFAHTAFAHFTTYLSVVHYNKPLGLFYVQAPIRPSGLFIMG